MNIQARDLIGVGVASLLLFPVIFFAVLLMSGIAKLEMDGLDLEARKKIAGYLERNNPEQAAYDQEQSRLYEANRQMALKLEENQQLIKEEAARLELLRLETSQSLDKMNRNREEIDKKVGEFPALSNQKIEELAQIYAAMKPVEAAPILLNLPDSSVARILKRVPDARSQGKLLAAIGALSTNRAASVTKILGWREKAI